MWGRIRKSLIALFCGQGLVLLEQVLLVPLFLAHWSPGEYGNWLTLSALTGLIGLLDLGMNTGAAVRLTQVHAQGNSSRFYELQHSAMAFYFWVAVLGSLLLTAGVLAFKSWPVGGIAYFPSPAARWTTWLLGIQMLWSMPHGFLTATYRTTGDMATTQWLVNGRKLVEITCVLIGLLLGVSMVGVASIELATLALALVFTAWHCRHWCRVSLPGLSRASWRGLADLLHPSFSFWTINWAQLFGQNVPVLLIRVLVGEIAVAVFVLCRTVTSLVRQGITLIHNSLWPEITRMETVGDWAQLRTLHRFVLVGSSGAAMMATGILWFSGDSLVRIWMRGKLPVDFVLLRLWLLHLSLSIPWTSGVLLAQASNRLGKFTRALSLSTLVGVLCSALLMQWLKTWAVPVGFILGEALFCCHPLIRESCRIVKEPYAPFARWFWKGWTLVLAATLGAGWAVESFSRSAGLLKWGLLAASSAGAVLFVGRTAWPRKPAP